jgi:hypothetical protein
VAGRLFFACGTLLVLMQIARGEGNYQHTKDGKTLVWNNHPNPGDVATWSGPRDRDGFARGFGQLIWYTKEPGFVKPQSYARYWGRMVDGKFEGPVNAHARRTTRYAIFIDGTRVTGWALGTAPSRATTRWRTLVAKRRAISEPSFAKRSGVAEPEAPAAGPSFQRSEDRDLRSEDRNQRSEPDESIQDMWSERWPKIDIDDSLRLLAFPPRSLRGR